MRAFAQHLRKCRQQFAGHRDAIMTSRQKLRNRCLVSRHYDSTETLNACRRVVKAPFAQCALRHLTPQKIRR